MRGAGIFVTALWVAGCAGDPPGLTALDAPVEEPPADVGDPGDDDGAGTQPTPPPCNGLPGDEPADEGSFVASGAALDALLAPCEGALHATAGAATSTLSVAVEVDGGASVTVVDLLGDELAHGDDGDGVEVTLAQSGEVLVEIRPHEPSDDERPYAVTVSCVAGCDLRFTRYPVFFLHGFGGQGDGAFGNFEPVVEALADAGYLAFAFSVDLVNAPPVRAEQWAAFLDELQAAGVARKFNLVGHSQGGLDARWLTSALHNAPRVATVTTIATPHRGTGLAEIGLGLMDLDPTISGMVDDAMGALAELLGMGAAELAATLEFMAPESMDAFAEATPDSPDVAYFSWSSRTCGAFDFDCQDATEGEVAGTQVALLHGVLEAVDGANDGIVPEWSSPWGDHLGLVPADHFEQVGVGFDHFSDGYDREAFFLSEADRLAAAGY